MSAIQAEPNTFPDLVELDALRLTVVVDNEVDHMSSTPKELGLTTLSQKLFKKDSNLDKSKSTVQAPSASQGHGHQHDPRSRDVKTITFDFNDLCCGAHGLSILVVKCLSKPPALMKPSLRSFLV